MKRLAAMAFLLMTLGSCAQPLEQIMEQKREERVKAVYAGQPLNHGAGDGLGAYIADDASEGLSVTPKRK